MKRGNRPALPATFRGEISSGLLFHSDDLTPGVYADLQRRGYIGDYQSEAAQSMIREALLAQFEAGMLKRMTVDISAGNIKPANKNFMRISEEDWGAFAKTFEGKPFLYDHNATMANKVGRITAASVTEEADRVLLSERVELTRQNAIGDALAGSMNSFSIGWDVGWVECSLCKADVANCTHWPGDQDDQGRACVFVTHENTGVETSAVVFPAYDETGLEAYQYAASLRGINPPARAKILFTETKARHEMREAILKALGLNADANDEEIQKAAVERLEAHRTNGPTIERLVALAELPAGSSLEDVERTLAARLLASVPKADLDALAAAKADQEARARIEKALGSGKITAKQAEEGSYFSRLAREKPEEFDRFVASLTPQVPMAGAAATVIPAGTPVPGARVLTRAQRDVCKLMRISEADYIAQLDREEKQMAAAALEAETA